MSTLILIAIGILIAKNIQFVKDADWLELKILKPYIIKSRHYYFVCRRPWWFFFMPVEYYEASDDYWWSSKYSSTRYSSFEDAKKALVSLNSSKRIYGDEEK